MGVVGELPGVGARGGVRRLEPLYLLLPDRQRGLGVGAEVVAVFLHQGELVGVVDGHADAGLFLLFNLKNGFLSLSEAVLYYLLGEPLVHVLVLLDPEREHQPVLWPRQRRGALAAVLVLVRQASVEGEAVAVGGRVGRPKVAKRDFFL